MILPFSPIDAYSGLLQSAPLATKAVSQSLIWGVGDVISQRREGADAPDWSRTSSFALTGLGGGVAWTWWYDVADALTAPLEGDAVLRTVASCAVEQFVWCPVIFAVYQIPCAVLQNGGRIEEIPSQVQSRLGDLLVANAKLWTPANVVVYNVPLQWRLLVGNIFDLAWGAYCSSFAAETVCEGNADDACEITPGRLYNGRPDDGVAARDGVVVPTQPTGRSDERAAEVAEQERVRIK